jgi:hypothetical protein
MREKQHSITGNTLVWTGAYLFLLSIIFVVPTVQVAVAISFEPWSLNRVFYTAHAVGVVLIALLSASLLLSGGIVKGRRQGGSSGIDDHAVGYAGLTAVFTCVALTVFYVAVIMGKFLLDFLGGESFNLIILTLQLILWACQIGTWFGLAQVVGPSPSRSGNEGGTSDNVGITPQE